MKRWRTPSSPESSSVDATNISSTTRDVDPPAEGFNNLTASASRGRRLSPRTLAVIGLSLVLLAGLAAYSWTLNRRHEPAARSKPQYLHKAERGDTMAITLEAIWVLALKSQKVQRIDLNSERIVSTHDLQQFSDDDNRPGSRKWHMAASRDAVWLINDSLTTLVKINSVTNKISSQSLRIRAPKHAARPAIATSPQAFISVNKRLWICGLDGDVLRVDPTDGRVDHIPIPDVKPEVDLTHQTAPRPVQCGFASNANMLSNDADVFWYARTFAVGANSPVRFDNSFDKKHIAENALVYLQELDPDSGQVSRTLRSEGAVVSGETNAMQVDANAIWIADQALGLQRIDPITGNVVASIDVGNPSDITINECGVFVSSDTNDTTTWIDPDDNSVVGGTVTGLAPIAVVSTPYYVWSLTLEGLEGLDPMVALTGREGSDPAMCAE